MRKIIVKTENGNVPFLIATPSEASKSIEENLNILNTARNQKKKKSNNATSLESLLGQGQIYKQVI